MFHISVITFKESTSETYFHLSSVTCIACYTTDHRSCSPDALLTTKRQTPDVTFQNTWLPGTLVLIRILLSCTVFVVISYKLKDTFEIHYGVTVTWYMTLWYVRNRLYTALTLKRGKTFLKKVFIMNDSWREYLHFPLMGCRLLITENKMVTKMGFYLGIIGVRIGTCNVINLAIPVGLYVFD
jgi:hypothetical protein